MTVYVKPDDPKGVRLPKLAVYLPELKGTEGNRFTQFGEDGLLEAIFKLIGETNRWCFEVGASDGVFFSATKCLRDSGWSAVLIESDDAKFETLRKLETQAVRPIHASVGEDVPIDGILCATGAPLDMDLGIIDIDGQDYWVWRAMERYKPRVMVVEYSPYDRRLVSPEGVPQGVTDTWCPKRGAPKTAWLNQAGLNPIIDLGTEKGYRVVAITSVNVLFVLKDLLEAK